MVASNHSQPWSGAGYERMFPRLAPLDLEDARLVALAAEMARPSRVPAYSELPAGYTYFGQLVAHDLSRMRGQQNLSRPRLWLDTVYGHPVDKWQHLYARNQAGDRVFVMPRGASLDGRPSKELDLPRNKNGYPDIPDERDDFHFIISQLHLAFMLLHNRLTSDLRAECPEAASEWIFDAARRKVCWSYQWLIVNDFLPRLCDESIMGRLFPTSRTMSFGVGRFFPRFNRNLFYEFALAGYRFGHSLVRPSYKLNDSLWTGPILHPGGAIPWSTDWRGHRKLPAKWTVQWNLFFGFAATVPQRACRISTSIAAALGDLPKFTIADDPEQAGMVNLAERTLRAGRVAGLPSGQDVARQISKDILPKLDLGPFEIMNPDEQDPLWYYVLKEASELGEGRRLGPVGSWIVALTISGVLIADSRSFLHDPTWVPDLAKEGDTFELRDLIRYAGLPIGREDWESYVAGNLPTWSFTEAL
jgi:hypothetical protein